jgi:hypothetical protein
VGEYRYRECHMPSWRSYFSLLYYYYTWVFPFWILFILWNGYASLKKEIILFVILCSVGLWYLVERKHLEETWYVMTWCCCRITLSFCLSQCRIQLPPWESILNAQPCLSNPVELKYLLPNLGDFNFNPLNSRICW